MSNQPQAGKKILFVVLGVFLSLFLALFLINQVKAVPSTPGSGSGIIKYNPAFPNSVSFSTSTVMIGTSTLDTTLLPNPPTSPSTNPKLFVNGQFVVNSIVANDIIANSINGGNFTGKIDAKNVLPGVFNQPDSGIYVFPGYLGIATTTQVGLPQALSVYGGGYFRDKISIGTANDVGSALLAENIESNSDAITGRNSSDIGESGGVGVRGIGSNNGGMGVIAETLDSVNGYDFVGFGPRSYFAGKVGIGPGVTSLAYQLEVGGTSMFENILEAKTATTTQIRWRRSTGSTFADLISPVGSGRVGISAKNVAAGAGGGLSFYVSPSTADTLAMTIIDTGNVGINTSNPQYKLDVNGTFHAATSTFTGQIQTATSGIRFFDGSTQTSAFMGGTTGSTGRVVFWQTTTTLGFDSNFFWDNTNKRLGIRTSVPNRPLTIIGENTNNELISFAKNDGTQKWYINTKEYSGFNGLNFGETGGADYSLFLKPGGNVGIGTGNPASKLGISGNVTIGLSSGFSDPNSPRAAPAGGLIVEGSVGIGTYTPSYSLHVAGNSMVTGSSSVAGTAFLNGDVNLGNAGSFTGDKINFVGGVASNINFYNAGPGAGITYDINGAVGGVGANGGGIIIKGGTSDGGASPLNSNGGDVSFLGGRGGESNSSSLGGNVNITGGSSKGTGGGAIIFNTYAPGVFASPTERMRISRTGNITTGAGTVGIGTTAQVSKLGVAGNVSIGSTYAASDAPSNGLLVEGNVNIGDTAAIAKLQVTSAGSSAIRLKKTAGVAGSVDLFVAIGGTGDGNAICRTVVPANSICLGYWTSGGATTACTGVSITGGRALCADFGD